MREMIQKLALGKNHSKMTLTPFILQKNFVTYMQRRHLRNQKLERKN